MQIAKHSVVKIDYTLTNPQGQVLDTSEGGDPLEYLHGVGGIIPGLENALQGKSEGDALTVTIDPQHAYGPRDEQLVQDVPRRMFQGVTDIKPGMQFRAQGPQGQSQVVNVVSVTPETVRIDANHPLAGVTLNFDVKVVAVRDATPDEIAHGHVHGPGGHHHH